MNINNLMQLMAQLKQNPMQMLAQKGINVPQDIISNPQAIVQYMLNNNMVSQQQVNQAMQMAKNFK